jgi:hypothetical protein
MKARSELKSVSITGYAMALYDNDPSDPVLIMIENQTFLPVYSTAEKLNASMELMNIKDFTVKRITDGADFLESVGDLQVCADPYIHNGNTRFTLVMRKHG